ncbi:LexA family protein [Streptomyces argenteolus]|uniref:LexA family protein n=1 Tax=Streptomyces sp. NPDC025273 TaxID=3155251 RepID=UPI0034081768
MSRPGFCPTGKRRSCSVIQDWITEHGEVPTVREIGARGGLSSTASVAYRLDRFEIRGLV